MAFAMHNSPWCLAVVERDALHLQERSNSEFTKFSGKCDSDIESNKIWWQGALEYLLQRGQGQTKLSDPPIGS